MKEIRYLFLSDISDTDLTKTFYAMSPMRRQKVLKALRDTDKKMTLAGEFLARQMIETHFGIPFDKMEISETEKGKPFVLDFPLYFSISHSGDMVAVAISDTEIGIDIQKCRPVSVNLVKRVCKANELSYVLGKMPEKEPLSDVQMERFFEIWTAKEAYFKCIGTGITRFQRVDTFSKELEKEKIKIGDYILHTVTIKR
ncbi:MAG: 4'-phosphopantetheinyl transferase superfamily protein [Clostridia bacterium]|nr:4'-phosphopantetheinyl transferase superfamily protein [Clostridia bacterium]